jgi:7-cyano-7-deazaguanine synthase
MNVNNPKAVVLLSGGLDSATALAMAREQEFECFALAVNYGQRHRSELVAARNLAKIFEVPLKEVKIDLRAIGGSALTDDDIEVPEEESSGIPPTYVPARNTVLLSLALGFAEVLGAEDIYIGVNAIDFSGYPDCRQEFIDAFQTVANLATRSVDGNENIWIHTPLIDMTKAQIIRKGSELGVDFSQTVSCYQADRWGKACGICDSCRIRKAGFDAAGIEDPTRYRRR